MFDVLAYSEAIRFDKALGKAARHLHTVFAEAAAVARLAFTAVPCDTCSTILTLKLAGGCNIAHLDTAMHNA